MNAEGVKQSGKRCFASSIYEAILETQCFAGPCFLEEGRQGNYFHPVVMKNPTMAMPKPMTMFQPPIFGMGNSVWEM